MTVVVPHYLRCVGLVFLSVVVMCALVSGCTAARPGVQVDSEFIGATIQQRVDNALQTDTHPKLVISGMSVAQGVAEFYRRRGFAPAWEDGSRIDQLITALEDLRLDGLDPADYRLELLRQQRQQISTMDAAALADFDIVATHSYLLALVHLYKGKVDPADLDSRWNFGAHALDPQQGMQVAIDAVTNGNIDAAFNRARPQQAAYPRLRAAMRQLYAIDAAGGWPPIDAGPTLKPAMRDPRVTQLRRRLLIAGILPGSVEALADTADADLYDAALSAAISRFQREQYLDVDGNVGPATLAALNVPVQVRMDQLRANLERGRWLLHEIHGDFVLVDIAGYKVHYYKNGVSVWSSRVQVGKPYRSTPEFKSAINYITVNPTWTVPPTIFRKDLLPKIKANPDYLAKQQLKVLDAKGNPLDASTIDWDQPGNILLRQDAGDDGALGKVVIRFPNPYAVYLHDTPHRREFGAYQRAFSSGCIRVEYPLELVERLFDSAAGWDRAAIDAAIASGETRNITLPRKIPLLLAYWTVDLPMTTEEAKAAGHERAAFKPDIYARDPTLIKALKSNPDV